MSEKRFLHILVSHAHSVDPRRSIGVLLHALFLLFFFFLSLNRVIVTFADEGISTVSLIGL